MFYLKRKSISLKIVKLNALYGCYMQKVEWLLDGSQKPFVEI